jgi:Fur family transcriptional regulator, ferric uptake regulator
MNLDQKQTSKESSSVLLPQHIENPSLVLDQTNQMDEFKSMIRKMGLKITEPRLIILTCLAEAQQSYSERHVTAQSLFERCHRKDPSIGFATVYRFLKDLTEHHLATEVRMGGQSSRYELTTQRHHDHLTCTKCGQIQEFENEKIEKLQQQVAAQFGFKLTAHILELYGLCRHCQ